MQEARRFLEGPFVVGEEPPPASGPPLDPAEAELRYRFSEAAFRGGDYAEAAEGFAAVVARDPAGAFAGPSQWQLTRSRLRSGDGYGALEALDGLLRHYGGWLGAQAPSLRAGLDRMAAGDLAGALEALERMLEEQPESELVPLAHALRARIYWNHGQPLDAIGAFSDLFASVRDEVPAYRALGPLLRRYARGDPGVAEEFAARGEEADEGFRDIYRYLAARSFLEQNRFEEARDALEELRRQHPEGDFSHIVDLEHAWNLLRNGRAAEALAIFQRLEQAPAPGPAAAFDAFFDLRAELPMGIARSHLALGDYPRALEAFERALAEHPRSVYVLENRVGMALAYERLGRLAEAEQVLRRAVEEHPDEPQLWAVRQQLTRIEARRRGE